MKKSRLHSIQVIRFIAFLLVFFQHANVLGFYAGTFGVTIFFMISGFVLYYNHNTSINGTKDIDGIKYTFNKIKSFYLLYITFEILGFIGVVIVYKDGTLLNNLMRLLVKLVMLQGWSTNFEFTFAYNGATWFVTDIVFLYLCSFRIIKMINAIPKKKIAFSICVLFFIQIIYICGMQLILKPSGVELISGVHWYYTYVFPPYRVFDFLWGGMLGRLWSEQKASIIVSRKNIALLNVGAISMAVLACCLYSRLPFAISNDLLFVPVSFFILSIALLNESEGKKWTTNKFFVFGGNIGLELFIVHSVVIRLCEYLANYNAFIMNPIVELGCSFLCAIIAKKIYSHKFATFFARKFL